MIEWAMFERYVEFRSRFDFEVIHNEINLASDTLRFGGTIDRVIRMNGKRILMDIKTSNAIHNHYWLQTAAYKKMLEELGERIDATAILWLNAKTRTEGRKGAIQGKGWQMVVKEEGIDRDWALFKHTHQLWLAENDGATPRMTEYQIDHQLKKVS